LVLERDANGNPQIENPDAPYELQRYKTRFIRNTIGTIIPSVGVVVES
jgi:hypothetical protein